MRVEIHRLPKNYIKDGEDYPRILIFYREEHDKEAK